MLRKRNTLICLTAVTLCFVGTASANAVGGSAGSYDSHDDAYFVIDCYLDGNGNTWVLLWDSFDDSTRWFVVWRGSTLPVPDCFPEIDGIPGGTSQGGDSLPVLRRGSAKGTDRLPIETIPLPE